MKSLADRVIAELKPKIFYTSSGNLRGVSDEELLRVLTKFGIVDDWFGEKQYGDVAIDTDDSTNEYFYELNATIETLKRILYGR